MFSIYCEVIGLFYGGRSVVNNRVIVQGVYHHHGRYGGHLADHFIVADALMRDWG